MFRCQVISTIELELQAILLGAHMTPDIKAQNATRVIIFTGSLKVIKDLRTPPRRHTTPHGIEELCGTFQRDHNIDIRMQWKPGHSGNPGNEEA